jgi:hypothetical protein
MVGKQHPAICDRSLCDESRLDAATWATYIREVTPYNARGRDDGAYIVWATRSTCARTCKFKAHAICFRRAKIITFLTLFCSIADQLSSQSNAEHSTFYSTDRSRIYDTCYM